MDENRKSHARPARKAAADRTWPGPKPAARLLLGLMLASAGLAGCSANYPAQHLAPAILAEQPSSQFFTMADGARLPYRQWLPPAQPDIVVLALHGFNDSRDAWELPAPAMAQSGIAVFAPDQRGFGAAPDRGRWPGTEQMAEDAGAMARQLARRYPRTRLFLMGESMGGAVLMQLASQPDAPEVAGYVLVAPAVWGRAEMNPLLRVSLWFTNAVVPGMSLSAGPFRVKASDNRAALMRLSRDPRTLIRTKVAALKGLTDLMDDALAASASITAPVLLMYGGHDDLVPKRATAAAWRALAEDSPAARFTYYPNGYHLLLRDLARAAPTNDLIAWLHNPSAPLPSPAESAAQSWLARQPPTRTLPPPAKPS